MSERSAKQIREFLDSLYRADSGQILATLIRLPGDFDLAEEAMHTQRPEHQGHGEEAESRLLNKESRKWAYERTANADK